MPRAPPHPAVRRSGTSPALLGQRPTRHHLEARMRTTRSRSTATPGDTTTSGGGTTVPSPALLPGPSAAGPDTGTTGTGAATVPGTGASDRPANRAERRAAKRGKGSGGASGPAAPRTAGPTPHVKPAHVRTDFAARRSG
ncbi:hypothetical protein Ae168Ps1_1360 [Pseudonocardia sp. Ae168_Ps1]|nr:hypothetical protein Ae150APs1_1356 [Pseudonocardia sp. Ae150A_Ps1]OLL78954.1 hypothetical protein Ae168Ps1_1360 [Pseudonocardia sp. Ae168_Ps1]OLL86908.1 hypothetical protein Ae263Ps1_3963c [Pseudonocardia sp. Ae263_Ps1]OLL93047.1 hypothetical protein Ae356Ps1_2944 [Pseudonocardia sp. Ae356_Ps1]